MSLPPPLTWPPHRCLQLAAQTLAQLLPSLSDAAAAAQVQAWAGAALQQLQRLAAAVQGAADGGAALAQEFAEVYRCWLALWAATQLPAGSGSWAASMAAAVAELAAGAAGPGAAEGAVPQLAAVAAAAAAAWQRRQRGDLAADARDASGSLFFLV